MEGLCWGNVNPCPEGCAETFLQCSFGEMAYFSPKSDSHISALAVSWEKLCASQCAAGEQQQELGTPRISPGASCPLSVPPFGDRFAVPECSATPQHPLQEQAATTGMSKAENSLLLGAQHPRTSPLTPSSAFIHPQILFPQR